MIVLQLTGTIDGDLETLVMSMAIKQLRDNESSSDHNIASLVEQASAHVSRRASSRADKHANGERSVGSSSSSSSNRKRRAAPKTDDARKHAIPALVSAHDKNHQMNDSAVVHTQKKKKKFHDVVAPVNDGGREGTDDMCFTADVDLGEKKEKHSGVSAIKRNESRLASYLGGWC
eukprot:CAMPEP_0196810426 /NCGR_PEP_ID=MMETSP1362-20130617/10246_1 /TAXON_ID=163516 /ORGANISM="Leptocylindrus danicus, Strain CCMP1856" /LENGTH=174 /DNA_ID=CAMNT_0042185411 /DNA_START=95 /DNA_END=619 /DNA_ORIENTATION=+